MSAQTQITPLLEQYNVPLTFQDIEDLVTGVLAAPAQHDDRAWLDMVAPDLPTDLADALQDYYETRQHEWRMGLAKEFDRSARLTKLRNEMVTFDVDGFIVPRVDEFQGEYVPACAERLAWLTGFTGSAGSAIVLKNKAAIFVDGRYTIQVRNQVNGNDYEYRHVTDSPAHDWLEENLTAGAKLAYDPWLHTAPSLMRLREACENVGAKLVAAPHNFIDAIWTNRPPMPLSPLRAHDVRYSGQHHSDKIAQIGIELAAKNQDCMFVGMPDSLCWLLNVRGGDVPCTPFALGFVLMHTNGQCDLFMDERKVLPATKIHLGNSVTLRDVSELGAALDQIGAAGKTIRVDSSVAPKWVQDRLKKAGAKVQHGNDLCALPKACKNDVEQEGSRQAHLRDGAIMVRFMHWLSQQPYGAELNEMSVARKLDSMRAEDDKFFAYSFDTISGASENGAMCHYRVSDESSIPLPENGLYLIDSGGQYTDGTTDITRTVARGDISAEMKQRYTHVLKGHIALATLRFPKGTTGSQIDAIARAPLWSIGLDYDHGTGHGVGSFLSVHEGPQRIAKMPNPTALEPGMILSNEPGYYKDGAYGIRIENLVIVQPSNGDDNEERTMYEFENLTYCPIDLNCIDVDLLSAQERDWLNDYHRSVFDKISPLLDDQDTKDWLSEATRAV